MLEATCEEVKLRPYFFNLLACATRRKPLLVRGRSFTMLKLLVVKEKRLYNV